MRTVTVSQYGGPDELRTADVPIPSPGPRQVLVKVDLAGVNYMDVYHRTGAVPLPLPFGAGVEGVGRVARAGAEVTDLAEGALVGWFSGGQGSYADYVLVEAERAVPVPGDVPAGTAVALLMQGVTAHYLATDAYPVQSGDTVLIHAAAGGVSQLLSQIVKLRGGRVIGTVSTPEKFAAARAAGADDVILYDRFDSKVRELTMGLGVAAVYDGVGAATFEGSLGALRPRGTLLIHGTASGPPPPLDIPRLNAGGSLYVTRPSIAHYAATAAALRRRADDVFAWVREGLLTVPAGTRFGLDEAATAHRAIESRTTTGKLLLEI
ncbi:quinone oxidoreductase family protein [Streptomyces sp. NPDC059255]|uniref:quinone oxidoreductase family protein n=1 Tax=Streptomyces sp. NPDC059255 TaxID=3346793 RepID=UPI00368303AF